jgi:predicted ATP-grasp superfamily ATP-dependent carboligase
MEQVAIMEIEREHKVPEGKLIRIRTRIENGCIEAIEIHGDFFLHPEQTIMAIEKDLIGAPLDEIAQRINRTLETHDAQLIGCSSEAIESTIRSAP